MILNFRACGISQGVRKLVQTPILIEKNNKYDGKIDCNMHANSFYIIIVFSILK